MAVNVAAPDPSRKERDFRKYDRRYDKATR